MNNRLVLGTVQFGLPYGIANKLGQINRNEGTLILEKAWKEGIDTLDTAISYGESEKCLGDIGVAHWQIISKLPPMPEGDIDTTTYTYELIVNSLQRLKVPKLYGVLLHRSQDLLEVKGEKIYQTLIALKNQGKIEKVGISIYNPNELDKLWPHYNFDLVQAPLNIIDRRLISSGWLTRLHLAGTEVHVRSVFLQGLLLLDASNRPPTFNRWQNLWGQWDHWLKEQNSTPLQACLGFIMAQSEIDRVLVGVDSLKQLEEIISNLKASIKLPPNNLMSEDMDLINPTRWGIS